MNFKRVLTYSIFQLLFSQIVAAQYLAGFVREKGSLEPLTGVSIQDTVSKNSCYSNEFGRFNLPIAENGQLPVLLVRYAGYTAALAVVPHADSAVLILLEPVTLKEVAITAVRPVVPALGQLTIDRAKLLQVPSPGGVPDLLRALATMPGVSTGGELFNGLLVRGGNPDQNLFLLDGAPVYGTTHLFNLVSLFNPDAISRAKLYKGMFPARYGGRASSVLDVRFREGRKDQWRLNWGLGLLNASILAEGPLGKRKKSSLLLAGRGTYLDLLTLKKRRAINTLENGSTAFNNFGFWDFNMRFNHEFNTRNKLFINGYYGIDYQTSIDQNIFWSFGNSMNFADILQSGQTLKNLSACMQYSHVANERSSWLFSASFNRFDNQLSDQQTYYYHNNPNAVQNINEPQFLRNASDSRQSFSGSNQAFRAEWRHLWKRGHQLTAGAESIFHQLNPGRFALSAQERDSQGVQVFAAGQAFQNPQENPVEMAVYVEDEISLWHQKLLLHPGFRVQKLGTTPWYFDPRLLVQWKLRPHVSVSASAGITTQMLHTLSGDANRFDKSIWVPAGQNNPAQRSRMVSAGVSFDKIPAIGALSVELFYRKMSGLTYFRFNPDDVYSYSNWPDKLIGAGRGAARGVDLLWQFRKAGFSTDVAYSLSWNNRQFDELNGGKVFPSKYDRRHDLKFSAAFTPKKSAWSFGATWFYNTGFRYTVADGTASGNPLFPGFPVFSGINNVKMPDYHRLDVMARWTQTKEKGLLKQYSWSFDVLNVYNRKNPYGLTVAKESVVNPDGSTSTRQKLKGVSVLPILPSITFRAQY
jgi:hypothetical protein